MPHRLPAGHQRVAPAASGKPAQRQTGGGWKQERGSRAVLAPGFMAYQPSCCTSEGQPGGNAAVRASRGAFDGRPVHHAHPVAIPLLSAARRCAPWPERPAFPHAEGARRPNRRACEGWRAGWRPTDTAAACEKHKREGRQRRAAAAPWRARRPFRAELCADRGDWDVLRAAAGACRAAGGRSGVRSRGRPLAPSPAP